MKFSLSTLDSHSPQKFARLNTTPFFELLVHPTIYIREASEIVWCGYEKETEKNGPFELIHPLMKLNLLTIKNRESKGFAWVNFLVASTFCSQPASNI